MHSFPLSLSFVVRLAAIAAVFLAASPFDGVLAGDLTGEKGSGVEVAQVDRWEVVDADRVRGTMLIRVGMREDGLFRPLGDAEVVLTSIHDPKSKEIVARTNKDGIARVDASYGRKASEHAGVQVMGVLHQAVEPKMPFGQVFKYHGSPLPAVFVLDGENARVQKFTPDGSFLLAWGGVGNGPGQFCPSPVTGELAVDSNSNVYVIDACNFRVQKFTRYGVYLTQWGTWGNLPGQLNSASGIAVDAADRVFVASDGRIQRFSSNGTFQTLISTAGEIAETGNLAIDPDGDLWVYDWDSPISIFEYALTGDFLGEWETGAMGDFVFDSDGTVFGGMVDQVRKVSPDGLTAEFWGPLAGGTGMVEFDSVEALAILGDHLYVLERDNNRVQILTTDGVYIGTFGAYGNSDGQFNQPTDIAIYS